MANPTMLKDYPDEKQRAAVCYSQFRGEKKASKKKMESVSKDKTAKDFDPEQLKIGTEIEMEHTDDPKLAEKIAMDHLAEDPDYYKKLKQAGLSLRIYQPYRLDEGQEDVLRGVKVCEVGEAKGHGIYLNERFLSDICQLTKDQKVRVRIDHPEEGKNGKLLTMVGEASNFRKEGTVVRADIKLFDVPGKEIIKTLAKQASDLFGMSLDFLAREGKRLKNGLKEVLITAVNAVDFVESPAATSSLFGTKVVDSPTKQESQKSESQFMNVSFDAEMIKGLGLDENKVDEKSILSACKNMMAKAAKFEAMKKHFETEAEAEAEAEDETKEEKPEEKKAEAEAEAEEKPEEKKEVKAEAEADEDKEDHKEPDADDEKRFSKIVEEQVAKQMTLLLSKIGTKPTPTISKESLEEKTEEVLTPEEKAFAKKHGIDEKAYALNLKAAREARRI